MKEVFNNVSVVALIVLFIVLAIIALAPSADTESQDSIEVTTAPETTVVETVEETVEETQPAVNNPVNDVNNSVDTPEHLYTQKDLDILAIIIYQEAGGDGCSDDTRRKVGSVFLNRVASPKFPNTFEAVATGRRQYGTLYLTGIKWPDRASNAGETHAVERAYRIAEELLTSGSILPTNVIWQAEFKQGDGVYCYQDGIYFCYSGGIE